MYTHCQQNHKKLQPFLNIYVSCETMTVISYLILSYLSLHILEFKMMNTHTQRESFSFHMTTKPSWALSCTQEIVLSIEMPSWLNGKVILHATEIPVRHQPSPLTEYHEIKTCDHKWTHNLLSILVELLVKSTRSPSSSKMALMLVTPSISCR